MQEEDGATVPQCLGEGHGKTQLYAGRAQLFSTAHPSGETPGCQLHADQASHMLTGATTLSSLPLLVLALKGNKRRPSRGVSTVPLPGMLPALVFLLARWTLHS